MELAVADDVLDAATSGVANRFRTRSADRTVRETV
jgi:hypothetical protein